MKLIDRIKTESTELGKWFQYKIPVVVGGIEILNQILIQLDPSLSSLVPIWVKQIIGTLTLISVVVGTYSVKNKTVNNE